ncbi:uncharacterized protein LOC124143985 [Haliotis rufescens]|uniref:uncharacterized protein LOC124143985 n=1 Tax=Haliotis rufescens TaxID=6454 RepID=UPI00201FA80B|nr:uncharacterized protein LOC124143985 [Haliotis rufescens]
MDVMKWIRMTNLYMCALLLVVYSLVHNVDCDIICLVDIRPILFLVIHIKNLVCRLGINAYVRIYNRATISIYLLTFHLLLVVCSLLWLYIMPRVISVLDHHIVESPHQRFFFFNHTKYTARHDDFTKFIYTLRGFQGEDTEMTCQYPFNGGQPLWLLDGEQLVNSRRYDIFWRNSTEYRTRVLRIRLLTHRDFGTYSLVVNHWNKTAEDLVRRGEVQLRNKFTLYSAVCEYILIEDLPQVETIMVPHGGIFKVRFSYSSSSEYIYVDKAINGKPLELVCDEDQGSWLMYIYITYILGQKELTYFSSTEIPLNTALFSHNVLFSHSGIHMCPKAFGNLSVSYFRRIFNLKKRRFELIEIEDAQSYIIAPSRSPFLDLIIDVLGWAKPTAGYTTMNEYTLQEMSLYNRAIELYVFIFLGFFCLILVFLIVFCAGLIVITLCFLKRQRSRQSRRYNQTCTYIVCCEEDTRWSVGIIDSVITEKGDTTYIHNRDTHPGQTELGGIGAGMRKCPTFVIVVSEFAVEDPMWQHQVDVILYRLVRREVPVYNVLFVRLDGARYPAAADVIHGRNVTIIDWEERSMQEQYVQARCDEVRCWVLASDPNLYLTNG